MRRPRLLLTLAAGALLLASAAGAQTTSPAPRGADDPCFNPRPWPDCRVFFQTNAGAYARLNSLPTYYGNVGRVRAVVDWGALVNLDAQDALGASWFVSLEDEGFATGPVLHWRRWLGGARSLDVAVGTPLAGGDQMRRGSVLGVVKYNPVNWFGVGVRPELRRMFELNCTIGVCTGTTRTHPVVLVGAEASGPTGFALSIVAGLTLGLLYLLYVAGSGID